MGSIALGEKPSCMRWGGEHMHRAGAVRQVGQTKNCELALAAPSRAMIIPGNLETSCTAYVTRNRYLLRWSHKAC